MSADCEAQAETQQANKAIIALKSNEGEVIEVDRNVAELSLTIKNMLSDLEIGLNEKCEVPLLKVDTATLELVVKWCQHHLTDYEELIDENSDRPYYDMSEWDMKFFEVDQAVLFKLLSASNYLDIKGLLILVCKSIAFLMKDKTIQQIRDTFGIEYDFEGEEAEQVRKETEWLEEN